MNTTTPLICSECGDGNYAPLHPEFPGEYFRCDVCSHTVNSRVDVAKYLDEGESLTVFSGLLSIACA